MISSVDCQFACPGHSSIEIGRRGTLQSDLELIRTQYAELCRNSVSIFAAINLGSFSQDQAQLHRHRRRDLPHWRLRHLRQRPDGEVWRRQFLQRHKRLQDRHVGLQGPGLDRGQDRGRMHCQLRARFSKFPGSRHESLGRRGKSRRLFSFGSRIAPMSVDGLLCAWVEGGMIADFSSEASGD